MTSEWHEVPLRELVGYISKGIAPSYAEEASETTIRVLNQKCNRNFRISYGDSRLHDTLKKKVPPERYVKPDDILINSTGAGTAGRIAQIEDVPSATTIDGHMILIRSNGKVTQKFLGYALKAHQWEVLQLDEGSTGQTELNRDRLLDEIMINYPVSFDEQNAIVGTLESIDRKLIVNKEINTYDYVEIIVRSYGCGKYVANGKSVPFKPREVGFVKNGRLSPNGYYDIHNDKNIRIVVDGEFKTINEVNFHEEDVGPLSREGAPYCIEDYILPVENFTQNINTNDFYSECVDIEDTVSNYISLWQPDRKYGLNYIEGTRWEVISPVLTSMLYAIKNGYAIDANTNDNFDSIELEFWLKPWEWLLPFDPAFNRADTNFIHIRS